VIRQADVLRRFSEGKGLPLGEEVATLNELASMQIDQRLWPVPASEDEPWSFLPSEKLRKEMQRRVRDVGSFGDTLAELYVWARLREAGFDVALTEDEGTADLEIQRGAAKVFGDVKRIRLGTSPSTAGSALTKANRQVKRSAGENAAGVVFIGVTRPAERAALDDRVPADVQTFVDEVTSELAGDHNKSIAAAIVYWDDLLVVDRTGDAGYFFRRRALAVHHAQPRADLMIPVEDLLPTAWFAVGIGLPSLDGSQLANLPVPIPRRRGEIVATAAFQQMNRTTTGVRTEHAIELFSNPDRVSVMPGNVLLATHAVSSRDFVLLGVASLRNGETQISMVFKLYEVAGEDDPEGLLSLFLGGYGLPVRVGDSVARLHPSVPASPTGALVVVDEPPQTGFVVHAVAEMGEQASRMLHCVFAFDSEQYAAAVRSKRS
jgi:hypothetical protein